MSTTVTLDGTSSRDARSESQPLPKLCEGLLALAGQLRLAAEAPAGGAEEGVAGAPDESDLRAEIHRHLAELDRLGPTSGVAPNDLHTAKYALVALLDETVLGSRWGFAESWATKPLQMELFNDFTAGEEFFRKLDQARGGRDEATADLLEIFSLCLGLGFMGKHVGIQGMDHLRQLKGELAQDIARLRGTVNAALADHAVPDRPLKVAVRNIPIWVVASACGAFVLLLYGILAWILSGTPEIPKG